MQRQTWARLFKSGMESGYRTPTPNATGVFGRHLYTTWSDRKDKG